MNKINICDKINVVVIYYIVKIYSKNIQIIAKLDEIFSHILNMNWLYHFNYNWKVWFEMWFHKKHMDKIFIQMNINVLKKNTLLKNYSHLKDDKNYVKRFCIKINFICLSKCYMKSKRRCSQNVPKYTQKGIHFLA
jgi:hypothetical protein